MVVSSSAASRDKRQAGMDAETDSGRFMRPFQHELGGSRFVRSLVLTEACLSVVGMIA